jgi:hypothetical protein
MQDAYGICGLSRVRGQETMEIGILNLSIRLSAWRAGQRPALQN